MYRNYPASKICVWLRAKVFKVTKPTVGTWDEWDEWDKYFESQHPVAFLVTEKIPKWIQWIPDHSIEYLDVVRIWVSNYLGGTHRLSSTLAKGQWHEFEDRVLYGAFDSFVDFVEIDIASEHIAWADESIKKKYPTTKWHSKFRRWGKPWRCAQAGIDRLKWEATLADDGVPTRQAVSAAEKLSLYFWWTKIRSTQDHREDSGVNAFSKEMDEKYGENKWMTFSAKSALTPEEHIRCTKTFNLSDKLNQQYSDYDDAMLIRLMKIRRDLWT